MFLLVCLPAGGIVFNSCERSELTPLTSLTTFD